MTRPEGNLRGGANTATAIVSSALTLLVCLSTWLLAGRTWLRDSGALDRQVSQNTAALAALPSTYTTVIEHTDLVKRVDKIEGTALPAAAHQELVARVAKLESSTVTREENTALLHALGAEIVDLRADIHDLQTQLREHDESMRRGHAQ